MLRLCDLFPYPRFWISRVFHRLASTHQSHSQLNLSVFSISLLSLTIRFFSIFNFKGGSHSIYSSAEISIPGDLNIHHQLWISSDHPGELAFHFAILHNLDQLLQHVIPIPDCLVDMPNILHFFLPYLCCYPICSVGIIWSQSHTLYFFLFIHFFPFPPQDPPMRRFLDRFASTN